MCSGLVIAFFRILFFISTKCRWAVPTFTCFLLILKLWLYKTFNDTIAFSLRNRLTTTSCGSVMRKFSLGICLQVLLVNIILKACLGSNTSNFKGNNAYVRKYQRGKMIQKAWMLDSSGDAKAGHSRRKGTGKPVMVLYEVVEIVSRCWSKTLRILVMASKYENLLNLNVFNEIHSCVNTVQSKSRTDYCTFLQTRPINK